MKDQITHNFDTKRNNSAANTLITGIAAFCTYSCMYAFRKPFTVGTFEGLSFFQIDYKVWLIIAQLLGYTLSKFYGIKFISESVAKNKAKLILLLIITAWVSLFFFAIIPAPYNIICLFLNGFPLGMVWGLVFSYLEGRRTTEFLGAALCVSFIFSSGYVKSVGAYLIINYSVTEFWMPFFTGLVFIIPLFISIFFLQSTPNPTLEDVRYRTQRKPMLAKARRNLLLNYYPGISLLIITYVILTVIRDFRDNFAAEIWKENNIISSEIFTKTEIPISIFILILISLLMFVKNNKRALFINHLIVGAGFVITLFSTYLFQINSISVTYWMVFSGVGLYMGYVPFNCIFFDRLISYLNIVGTVGFLMYLADSFGYLGSFSVLLIKEIFSLDISWTNFLIQIFSIASVVGIFCMILSWFYFNNQKRNSYE